MFQGRCPLSIGPQDQGDPAAFFSLVHSAFLASSSSLAYLSTRMHHSEDAHNHRRRGCGYSPNSPVHNQDRRLRVLTPAGKSGSACVDCGLRCVFSHIPISHFMSFKTISYYKYNTSGRYYDGAGAWAATARTSGNFEVPPASNVPARWCSSAKSMYAQGTFTLRYAHSGCF